jgi:2-hydroxychromene-2-carboxylate isomerase
MPRSIVAYFDYKSPYAYLAKDLTYKLAAETGVDVDWRPYTLDIPAYLGDAEVDADGKVVAESRNAHQWRRVRYSYMDCRRHAERRGLVIRGPRKIFDSTTSHIDMLYAQRAGVFRPYHDAVFERFWKRELDIEDAAVVGAVLAETGCEMSGFEAFLGGEGRESHDRIRVRAEDELGIFGVPSFVVDGEVFWGREHLPLVRARLRGEVPTGDPASVL